ncbi:MAG: hypothetical protein MZU91_06550 [Desulfosudis oleivorans]|nr:hypothetical protein [Desulfosudis oleivorans]
MKLLGKLVPRKVYSRTPASYHPDAILLDWNLPGFHPQRLIPALRECSPTAILVALSVKPEHEKIAKEYGMDGFYFQATASRDRSRFR